MDTVVLKVQLQTAGGGLKTLTFEEPVSDLTLAQVTTAFGTLLSNGWLLAGDGNAFSAVSEAAYVTTTPLE